MYRIFKGITLTELIIATTISILLIGFITSAYLISARIFNRQVSRSDIFWDGQRAAQAMTDELRECREVISPEAHSVTYWWKDLNDNGSREANETARFSLVDQNLVRSIGDTGRGLANHVASLEFEYDTTPHPHLVSVTVTLVRQGEMITIESKAMIRNED